jgi:hypothetical protein
MALPTVFSFAPLSYSDEFQAKGYVYIRNGVLPTFLAYARAQALQPALVESPELSNWQIAGKKRQRLFQFPNTDSLESLIETLAVLSSLDRAKLIVSERHIKLYDLSAPPFPIPHKDRLASQIAVGIPLETPKRSRLVLFPMHGRTVNRSGNAITWQDGLEADAPELLTDAKSLVFDTRPGDVIIFGGSSIYHEREYAAGAVILYLKLNAMGLDPLGEDPRVRR